jgi:8-oxo-dGTP diphosphatase
LKVADKAFAYVTSQERLLVFVHVDFPDAGVQVPAGTVLPSEAPGAAAVREAYEETGLDQFWEVDFLGMSEFDARPYGKDEIHRRHFFHLPLRGPAPERWRHHERDPSDGLGTPIEFELYWAPLAAAEASLAYGHGALLEELRRRWPSK